MTASERGAAAVAGGALGGLALGGIAALAGAADWAAAFAFFGLVLGTMAGAAAAGAVPRRPAVSKELEAAALALDLKRRRRGARFIGTLGNGPIEIDRAFGDLRVSFANLVRPLAIVRTPGMFSSRPSGEDLRTGDDAFDAAVHVAGSETMVRALLDHETRKRIVDVLETAPDFRVAEGKLTWSIPANLNSEEIVTALRALAAVAERLRRPDRAKLAPIVRADPIPAVRLAALKALLADPRGVEDLSRAVARDACGDPDPEVRLEAAAHEDDLETLHALAIHEPVDPRIRTEALLAIESSQREAAIRAVSDALLDTADARLRAHAIELIGRYGIRASLAKILTIESNDWHVRKAQAKALSALPDPMNEPVLIRLLDPPDESIAIEVLAALEKHGTVAAIPALREIFRS